MDALIGYVELVLGHPADGPFCWDPGPNDVRLCGRRRVRYRPHRHDPFELKGQDNDEQEGGTRNQESRSPWLGRTVAEKALGEEECGNRECSGDHRGDKQGVAEHCES